MRERLISLELSEIEPSGRGRLAKSFSRSGRKSSSRIKGGKKGTKLRRRRKARKKMRASKKGRERNGLAYRKNRKLPLDVVIEKINHLQPKVRIMLIDSI